MATLRLAYSDIYAKVSEFLGLGSSPAGDNLTLVKDLTHRGYRRFLTPFDMESKAIYLWSFLKKRSALITTKGKADYLLPSDLISLISGFKFNAGEDKQNPEKIEFSKLSGLRSLSVAESLPEYYTITNGGYDKTTGQLYEVWFHKPPDAAYTYRYRYIFNPDELSATTDLFVGNMLSDEVILQCAIAAAELQEDEVAGVQEAKAASMLAALIKYDMGFSPDSSNERDPDIQSLSQPAPVEGGSQ